MQRSTHFPPTRTCSLKTFASFISLATLSERTRNKAELLLQMSRAPSVEKLFNLVATRLPELIHHTDCFVFELERSEQPCLNLVQSNCTTVPLTYSVGEGKTGISAAETTTVIDHYGRGRINAKRIEERRLALDKERPQDLLADLCNEDGDRVGIIRLENGRDCPEDILSAFDEMCRRQVIHKGKGLPSPHMDAYSQMHSILLFLYQRAGAGRALGSEASSPSPASSDAAPSQMKRSSSSRPSARRLPRCWACWSCRNSARICTSRSPTRSPPA
jgi:hypothetical protein